MKVTKTSPQPTFQPIEIKITIESEDDLEYINTLYRDSSEIYDLIKHSIDSDAAFFLEDLLDKIGEAL